MVVDDNKDGATTLSLLLKVSGYQTYTCFGGQEALKVAASQQPEVVLLDLAMPDLDGYETCQLMRQQPWGRDMLIIALSGYGSEEDSRQSREVGFDRHLVKPIDLEVLKELLNRLPARD